MCTEGKGVPGRGSRKTQGPLGTRLQGRTQPSSPGQVSEMFAGQENVSNPKQKEGHLQPFPPLAGHSCGRHCHCQLILLVC